MLISDLQTVKQTDIKLELKCDLEHKERKLNKSFCSGQSFQVFFARDLSDNNWNMWECLFLIWVEQRMTITIAFVVALPEQILDIILR